MKFAPVPGRAYEVQTTEVTQRQWKLVMDEEPWKGRRLAPTGDAYPAVYISWHDAVEFAARLNKIDEKYRYRLPTDDEWRHAARAGRDSRFCFGSDPAKLKEYAWYRGNWETNKSARAVGQLKANEWGLYDVNGNVWEWCADERGRFRVTKGGAWFSVDWFCDVRKSPTYGPLYRSYGVGFRLLREPRANPKSQTGK
jgi:formylglycine-generating enzyme required for sulfatase activity